MARGEFMYSIHAFGWVLARDRRPLPGLPLYTWDFCPWCGGALPNEETAVTRLWLDDGDDARDTRST